MKFTDVQVGILIGLQYGYQIAAKETRRDVEDLVQELKDANAEIRAELALIRNARARCQAMESAGNAEHDPETRPN
jgi:hypothetical protein